MGYLWALLFLLLSFVLQIALPLAGIGLLLYAGFKRKWKLFRIVLAVLVVIYAASVACPATRLVWTYR